jgi:heme-degrading monooxygenase HmoA
MYVGAIFYKFKPGEIEGAVKEWEDMVLKEAKRQKGFIKADMFINEDTGEGLDIGFWETMEDAQHFQDTGLFDLLAEGLKDFILEKPRRVQFKRITSV